MSQLLLSATGSTPSPASAVVSEAVLSPCGTYRYRLTRAWADGPRLLWCMLNPSTADAEVDDPTIRRCMSFSRREGFAGLEVVNLFGFRATDSADLVLAIDPVGPGNDVAIEAAAVGAPRIVAAWGSSHAKTTAHRKRLGPRERAVLELLRRHGEVYCLGTNAKGRPKHPLYLRDETPLERLHWKGG
jgi:hypothetical protein